MLKIRFTRLSIAAALAAAASGTLAANHGIDVNNANNGLFDIYSATFDGALAPCGAGASTYCTFFGGDPGGTRQISITPDPSMVVNAAPGGIGPAGIPVAPLPASGTILDLTLGGGNTLLTLGVSSIRFGDIDICISQATGCATLNVHAEAAGMVFNPTGLPNAGALTPAGGGSTGATVAVNGNGQALFQVQNAGAIVVDFSRLSQVVTSCTGTSCTLITGDILNLDIVRYVLEIDYDTTFTSFTGNFIGETSGGSLVYATLNSAVPDGDADGIADGLDNCPVTLNPTQVNSDADSRGDACDNCTLVGVPDQLDTNNDGYGNICDADLNNSNLTTATDFNLLRSVLNKASGTSALAADADMNGSGLVTATDFNLLRARLNSAPGPSGLSCAGIVPCPAP